MGRHRKLPSREEVVRLYVQDGISTPEIARMFGVSDPHTVRAQLLRAGVTLRRHTVVSRCVECGQPVVKTLHKKIKSLYGKRCAIHQKEHRKKVCADYGKRFREANPEIVQKRYEAWVTRLRNMNPNQLLKEIKEKPCLFKKEELLRKIRKLSRMGKYQSAVRLVVKSFPTILPKRA